MGLGYTEPVEGQIITPETQVQMLAMFFDSLQIDAVDLVANDSGGLLSQLFVARYPHRVRTLLLTNCDVDRDSPPALFVPLIDLADKTMLIDEFFAPQIADKQRARSSNGLGSAYSFPDRLTDETIEIYLRPLVDNPRRSAQLQQYTSALRTNPLMTIHENLRRWNGPARIVWGMSDPFFSKESANWLDQTLPGSRGVRRIPNANLFFPEEMPDIIAEEAIALWTAPSPPRDSRLR
jgi:pimeloyl-ACP methyl ester carboxylesterase